VKQVIFFQGCRSHHQRPRSPRHRDGSAGHRSLAVIHPIDVLDSRIQNLHLFARETHRCWNRPGAARQWMSRARYSARSLLTGVKRGASKLLERVAEHRRRLAAVRVFLPFGIDLWKAFPLEDFRTTALLHKVRWPAKIVADVSQKGVAAKSFLPVQSNLLSKRPAAEPFWSRRRPSHFGDCR